jgi:hypothetical protein
MIFTIKRWQKYAKYEIQQLSKRKNDGEGTIDAVGRPFKFDIENRF